MTCNECPGLPLRARQQRNSFKLSVALSDLAVQDIDLNQAAVEENLLLLWIWQPAGGELGRSYVRELRSPQLLCNACLYQHLAML